MKFETRDQNVILKTMNYLLLNRNFSLKLQGNCWEDYVLTLSSHLSVTMKLLTRYKQKVVLAAMFGGQEYTNHTTLLKNQSAIKYLPEMRFLSNFWCMIIFMRSVKFWHQQDSNSLFKGSIGHVTSWCKWYLLCHYDTNNSYFFCM